MHHTLTKPTTPDGICRDSSTNDLYYSASWQVLHETGTPGTFTCFYSPVYVNAVLARESGGTRLYNTHDANYNVTALVATSGTVAQRMAYTAYGDTQFLEADFDATSDAYATRHTFQGGRRDLVTGMINFQQRDYNVRTYTWSTMDPIHDGLNWYAFVGNNPINGLDPSGLLTVYFWDAKSGVGIGHAAMQLKDGTYLSWWPKQLRKFDPGQPKGKAPTISSGAHIGVPQTYAHDIGSDGEQRDPESIIHIDAACLDEAAIKKWWNNFLAVPDQAWEANYNNCATVVANALNAGSSVANPCYASLTHSHLVWSPRDIESYALCLERWCNSKKKGVCAAAGRYWWEMTKEGLQTITGIIPVMRRISTLPLQGNSVANTSEPTTYTPNPQLGDYPWGGQF